MAFNNSSSSACNGSDCVRSNLFNYTTSEKVAIVLANALIFCLAVPANGIVIAVISRVQNVRTPTSTFLLNLCVADILMASLYIPFITVDFYVTGHWVFGDFMCRLVSFVYYLATYFSILILTTISVERYISVCLSRRMRLTDKKAFITTVVLWLVAACLALPLFIVRRSISHPSLNGIEYCVVTWPFSYIKVYTLVTLTLFYIMPIAFMAMVYYKIGRKVWASADKTRSMKLSKKHASNSKLRLTKIALAIILSFVISWTPLNTVNVLFFFGKRSSSFSASTAHIVYPIMYWVAFSNCALNPLLYCYMSQNFRKAFTIFRHRRSRSYLADSISAVSRSSSRRFSRRGKRKTDEHLADEPNGVPANEGDNLRTVSDKSNHDGFLVSQHDSQNTKETILIVSAL